MNNPTPILETSRLLLRKWQQHDVAPFAAMNQCPQVMEHFPNTLTPEESANAIKAFNAEIAQQGFGLFACELKTTAQFIGFVGLHIPPFHAHFTPCVEIAWRLAQPFWGQGYATEAARAVLQFGFEQCKLTEIVSFTVLANTRSRRVMEKLGMQHNPRDDFDHPKLPIDHPLAKHVLYRLSYKDYKPLCPNYPK